MFCCVNVVEYYVHKNLLMFTACENMIKPASIPLVGLYVNGMYIRTSEHLPASNIQHTRNPRHSSSFELVDSSQFRYAHSFERIIRKGTFCSLHLPRDQTTSEKIRKKLQFQSTFTSTACSGGFNYWRVNQLLHSYEVCSFYSEKIRGFSFH